MAEEGGEDLWGAVDSYDELVRQEQENILAKPADEVNQHDMFSLLEAMAKYKQADAVALGEKLAPDWEQVLKDTAEGKVTAAVCSGMADLLANQRGRVFWQRRFRKTGLEMQVEEVLERDEGSELSQLRQATADWHRRHVEHRDLAANSRLLEILDTRMYQPLLGDALKEGDEAKLEHLGYFGHVKEKLEVTRRALEQWKKGRLDHVVWEGEMNLCRQEIETAVDKLELVTDERVILEVQAKCEALLPHENMTAVRVFKVRDGFMLEGAFSSRTAAMWYPDLWYTVVIKEPGINT